MVTAGHTRGTAQLAATACTRSAPESRSKTVSSPVSASTAVIFRSRSGQSTAPMREAITSIRLAPPGSWARMAILPTRARLVRELPGSSRGGTIRSRVSRESLAPISLSAGSSWPA